jgi:hypothetical protein
MASKKDLRDFLERLFKDRPEERERILQVLDDDRFSCHDWMEEAGYTQEQRLAVLKSSGDITRLTMERLKKKPVPKWTAEDWENHEILEWQSTDIFREMLKGYFTSEEVNEIAEAWEHERYVRHSIGDGYGLMHHCRFCSDVTN